MELKSYHIVNVRFAKCLVTISLFVLAVDLFFFGGGRVVDFGGVTFRMLIFSHCIFFSTLLILFVGKVDKLMVLFLATSLLLIVFSSYISLLKGEFNVSSVSQYLFVFLAVLFSIFPNKSKYYFEKVLPYSSILMSVIYIFFIFMLFIGKVSILDIYSVIPSSEVFLRGQEGLVYKGFVFIMIGILYFLIVKSFKFVNALIVLILFFAILLTLTRGFVLSVLLTIFYYFMANGRVSFILKVLFVIVISLISILLFSLQPEFLFRAGSDNVRVNDFLLFLTYLDQKPENWLFGNGISSFLGERHSVENVYMDVVLRFGFFGLALLLLVYFKIYFDYRFLKHRMSGDESKSIEWLYFSVFLLYLQSAFNPYVNNYIGGVFVIMVLFYFNYLRKEIKKNHNVAHSLNSHLARRLV